MDKKKDILADIAGEHLDEILWEYIFMYFLEFFWILVFF